METRIRVRAATVDDSASLDDLFQALGYPASPPTIARRIARLRADVSYEAWVAVSGSSTVGFGAGHILHPVEEDRPAAQLIALVTTPAQQGSGVGTALCREFEHWARGHGARRLLVNSGEHRHEYEVRLAAGEGLAPLIASFQALVVRQIVPEWRAVLYAVQKLSHVGTGPVGYWGLSQGCVIGVPFVAAESRVRAAVLGLGGGEVSAESAGQITVPMEFLVQWDDERVPRTQSLALFDAFASAEKTLHANLGKHGEVPAFEIDSTLRFLARHLD